MSQIDKIEAYIDTLSERVMELKQLHNAQVDDRERISIATRSATLGKLRGVRTIIGELKALIETNKEDNETK